MSLAALKVYQTLRKRGTQKELLTQMQTRAELYEVLNYEACEKKLDEQLTRWNGLKTTKRKK